VSWFGLVFLFKGFYRSIDCRSSFYYFSRRKNEYFDRCLQMVIASCKYSAGTCKYRFCESRVTCWLPIVRLRWFTWYTFAEQWVRQEDKKFTKKEELRMVSLFHSMSVCNIVPVCKFCRLQLLYLTSCVLLYMTSSRRAGRDTAKVKLSLSLTKVKLPKPVSISLGDRWLDQ